MRSPAAISRAATRASAFAPARDSNGSAIAVTRARIASTTTTSISVKPRCREASLPVRDILVLACPARRAIGAEAVKIIVAVIARNLVEIGAPPGIGWNTLLLEIGPVPAIEARRMLDQCFEPFGLRRVAPHIEAEQIECAGEVLDLDMRGIGL